MPVLTGLARLGRDTELRNTPGGMAVAKLALAFNVQVKGEKQTVWCDGALWGKRAEALTQYLTKGALVSVTLNEVHIEKYTKTDETVVHKLVGQVVDIELGPKPSTEAAAPPPPPPPPKPKPAASADDFGDVPFILSLLEYSVEPSKARRLRRASF